MLDYDLLQKMAMLYKEKSGKNKGKDRYTEARACTEIDNSFEISKRQKKDKSKRRNEINCDTKTSIKSLSESTYSGISECRYDTEIRKEAKLCAGGDETNIAVPVQVLQLENSLNKDSDDPEEVVDEKNGISECRYDTEIRKEAKLCADGDETNLAVPVQVLQLENPLNKDSGDPEEVVGENNERTKKKSQKKRRKMEGNSEVVAKIVSSESNYDECPTEMVGNVMEANTSMKSLSESTYSGNSECRYDTEIRKEAKLCADGDKPNIAVPLQVLLLEKFLNKDSGDPEEVVGENNERTRKKSQKKRRKMEDNSEVAHRKTPLLDPKWKCYECNKNFRYEHIMADHIRLIHSGASAEEKCFNCELCEYKTKREQDLKKHLNAMHLGQVYPCQDCGRVFKYQSNLRRHVKIVHLKIPNFLCACCGKLFLHADNLKKHMAVHEIQVICQVCDKQFMTQHKLKMHLIRVHVPKVGFNCPFCEYVLASDKKERLKRHVRENHKALPHIPQNIK